MDIFSNSFINPKPLDLAPLTPGLIGLGKGIGSSNPNSGDDIRLKKACGEFEALLINHMIEQIKKTVKKSSLFGDDSFASESFSSLLDTELSKNFAQVGGLGIADIMYEQLRNLAYPGAVR